MTWCLLWSKIELTWPFLGLDSTRLKTRTWSKHTVVCAIYDLYLSTCTWPDLHLEVIRNGTDIAEWNCHNKRSAAAASIIGQHHWPVSSASVIGQCHRPVSSASVIGQRHWPASLASATVTTLQMDTGKQLCIWKECLLWYILVRLHSSLFGFTVCPKSNTEISFKSLYSLNIFPALNFPLLQWISFIGNQFLSLSPSPLSSSPHSLPTSPFSPDKYN